MLPRGSYPVSFLGRLPFKIKDPNHKTRYPKKGVGYEPLGKPETEAQLLKVMLRQGSRFQCLTFLSSPVRNHTVITVHPRTGSRTHMQFKSQFHEGAFQAVEGCKVP